MSIQTWKDEFYYIDAKEVPGCVPHSLLKWEGLRPENLRKHGVFHEDNIFGGLADSDDNYFTVTGINTCSLCKKYLDHDCQGCPVGGCHAPDSAYQTSLRRKSPEPMIRLLETL